MKAALKTGLAFLLSVSSAETVCATEFKFNGTVDNCLDNPANWDDYSALTASDWGLMDNNGASQTVTISADWTVPFTQFRFGNYTFDLGKDRTITSQSTSGYGFIVGHSGFTVNLVSGNIYVPNTVFRIGTYPGHNGHANLIGADSHLVSKGVYASGAGKSSLSVTDGATIDALGGSLAFNGPSNRLVVVDSAVTNFTSVAFGSGNGGSVNRGSSVVLSNAVVQSSDAFLSLQPTDPRVVVAQGTKLTVRKFDFSGNGLNMLVTDPGTDFFDTYDTYNGYFRLQGASNTVEVTKGAVLRGAHAGSLYSSCGIGRTGAYKGSWNTLAVTDGGRIDFTGGLIYIGEPGSTTAACRNNRLIVSGVGSVAKTDAVEIGNGYNSQCTLAGAVVFSNELQVLSGGVVSNLSGMAMLPRQGHDNRVLIDGGSFVSPTQGVQMGSDILSSWGVATNNLLEIRGGGTFVSGSSLTVFGCSNAVKVVDGLLAVSDFNTSKGTSTNAQVVVGAKGRIRVSNAMALSSGATLHIDLPATAEEASDEALIEVPSNWFRLYAGTKLEFGNLEACAKACGGKTLTLVRSRWMDISYLADVRAALQTRIPRAKLDIVYLSDVDRNELRMRLPATGLCVIVK